MTLYVQEKVLSKLFDYFSVLTRILEKFQHTRMFILCEKTSLFMSALKDMFKKLCQNLRFFCLVLIATHKIHPLCNVLKSVGQRALPDLVYKHFGFTVQPLILQYKKKQKRMNMTKFILLHFHKPFRSLSTPIQYK